MKKTILILVLALFAFGYSTATYGQLLPRTIECVDLDDPLNVVPGQPYTYDVDVPTPPGTKTYHWFVTQDVNMISSGNIIATIELFGGNILASGSGTYNNVNNTYDTLSLTFQSFQLAVDEYVFLGLLVTNTDPTLGCTTNNFKVYRIKPVHAFTLDIANVNAGGVIVPTYGSDTAMNCMSPIISASFQVNAGDGEIVYNFGTDTLFYAVAAANYSGSWELEIDLTGLGTGETAIVSWGYDFANAGDYVIAPAGSGNGTYTSTVDVAAQGSGGSVGPAGETIYLRMIVDHGTQFEGNTDPALPYSLAVNGNLVDDTGTPIPGMADRHHLNPCGQVDFDDIALQSLVPRPEVNSVIPAPPGYLPIAP